MTDAENLKCGLVSAEVNETFTEAVLRLQDESRLCFCHRVGERWAKAVGPDGREQAGGLAAQLLATMTIFRLNARHLEIEFGDGSRWEMPSKAVANRDPAAAHGDSPLAGTESPVPGSSASPASGRAT